jgi:hypothetical protein
MQLAYKRMAGQSLDSDLRNKHCGNYSGSSIQFELFPFHLSCQGPVDTTKQPRSMR